jgi:hypothetical protein
VTQLDLDHEVRPCRVFSRHSDGVSAHFLASIFAKQPVPDLLINNFIVLVFLNPAL